MNDPDTDLRNPPALPHWKRVLLALAALVVGASIAVPAGWWWQQSRAVQAALEAIRARGEPVTPAELYAMNRLVPPDKDCFALYQADDSTWMQSYVQRLRTLPQFDSDQQPPALDEEWDGLAFAEQFLLDCRADFARWHRAAALGGAANFPIHAEEGFGGTVPWLRPVRGIVHCLLLQAYVQARHGDCTAAADSLHDAVVIAQSLDNNPLVVSQLIRMLTHRELLKHLKHLLTQAPFDAQDLARLQADLAAVDMRPGLRLGLIGDRVTGIVSAQDPSTMGYSGRTNGRTLTAIHHVTKQHLALGFLDDMKTLIELADKPWPAVIGQTEATKLPSNRPPRSTFDFDLLPEFLGHTSQYVRQGARTTAANQIGILAIALTRYRRDHDRFPETLNDLVPAYVKEIPLDATSGKPFLYTLDERGLTLRSGWHDMNSKIDPATGADQDLLFHWPAAAK